MSISGNSILSILLLAILITFLHAEPQYYVIKKDFRIGLGKKQWSVYDLTEKVLKYRIKSKFVRTSSRQIYAYPSGEVVGKLTRRWTWSFKADISVLNSTSNSWIHGNITKMNKVSLKRPVKYSIYWNDQSLAMETHITSYFRKMYVNDSKNDSLAEFSKRPELKSTPEDYLLTINSNKFSDAFYLLLFTVEEFPKFPPKTDRLRRPFERHPLDPSH